MDAVIDLNGILSKTYSICGAGNPIALGMCKKWVVHL